MSGVGARDANGRTTRWDYDPFGRLANKVDAASTARHQYDANNRLTNLWTPAKLDTFFNHDAVGNLLTYN